MEFTMMEADESFIVFRAITEVLKKGTLRAFTSLGSEKYKIWGIQIKPIYNVMDKETWACVNTFSPSTITSEHSIPPQHCNQCVVSMQMTIKLLTPQKC